MSRALGNVEIGDFLRVFGGAIIGLLTAFALLSGDCDVFKLQICILVIVLSVALVVHVRDNSTLFIIGCIILLANYSACAANTFPPYQGYDVAYSSDPLSAEGMGVLLLFMCALLVFLPSRVRGATDFGFFERCEGFRYSGVAVALIAALLVVIFFTCSSGFADTGGRAENNSIFEYSYILFILGFYLSGGKRVSVGLLVGVALLYCAQTLTGGNRASVLAIISLLFVLFFSSRMSWRKVLPVLLVGIVLMMSLGYYRSSSEMFVMRFFDALWKTIGNLGIWDTASYAFHQSIAFLRLDEILSASEHLELLSKWMLSWFVGGSLVPGSNLALYAQTYFPGMGGGFLPMYLYFYGGIAGVVCSGAIVAVWFRLIAGLGKSSSSLMCVLCVAVSITFCRWYLYSPSPLTTGLVFMTIAYAIIRLVVNPKVSMNTDLRERKRGFSSGNL